MVEFTLVALPFIGIILASVQTALVFTMGQALQTATMQSARLLMTGQSGVSTAAAFKADVCSHLPGGSGSAVGFNCDNLLVDVRSAGNFSSLDTGPVTLTYDAQHKITNSPRYDVTAGGAAVIVRVMYAWPTIGSGLGIDLANQAGQPAAGHLMVGTAVLKNEPY